MIENVHVIDWIRCPHCGCEEVEMEHFGLYETEYRARVNCPACGAGGYFD